MTVAHTWPLQQAVYARVSAAVAAFNITVLDHAPTQPPNEYIRLDGFGLRDNSPKDAQRAMHHFEVHYFLRPIDTTDFTRGQRRAKQVMPPIHDALMAQHLLGEALEHEYLTIDKDVDGITTHAVSRYTITI